MTDTHEQLNALKARRDLEWAAMCRLRPRMERLRTVTNVLITRRDRLERQYRSLAQAYQATDLALAELDGRLKQIRPKAPIRRPRKARKDPSTAEELLALLKGQGLTQAQIDGILDSFTKTQTEGES